MNNNTRIAKLFSAKQDRVLNVYCTAGFPKLDNTIEVMQALEKNGADIIELGMPYSDPVADGPVIQNSNAVAIANGMTIPVLFEQLHSLRSSVTVPVILMGYINPVLQYGFERFCRKAKVVGIDGLIIPDLPLYEFETEFAPVIKRYGLDFIFLVTPETSTERIKRIDALSSGFLYAVSSSSITGNTNNINDQEGYFKKLKELKLQNPVLVGFGIKDKETFDAACKHLNGAIIGSAYINAIQSATNVNSATEKFLTGIKAAQPSTVSETM